MTGGGGGYWRPEAEWYELLPVGEISGNTCRPRHSSSTERDMTFEEVSLRILIVMLMVGLMVGGVTIALEALAGASSWWRDLWK